MPVLSRFSTPANIEDAAPDAWSATVAELVAPLAERFAQFYDPTASDTPADAAVASVVWPAFPGSLRGGARERLEIADRDRGTQDEYCEWAVERNGQGEIARITFTTEVPEYFDHLFATDRAGLVALYQAMMGREIDSADLQRDGGYLRTNRFNDSTAGRPAHLIQSSNTVEAAIRLAAEATVLRRREDGTRVTHRQELVECGGLGEPLRNSDPQIASAVNDAAASGAELTPRDPIGLYIDGLITGGMETPDGEDPAAFWTTERGIREHTLRAFYEVPAEQERGYGVGEITIDGQPIEFGGQLAQRVRVRIDAVVKPGSHQPEPQPCVG